MSSRRSGARRATDPEPPGRAGAPDSVARVDTEPDAIFAEPRLAAIYDDLDPDRSDLEPYRALVRELGATSVLDVGCGTGTFASLLVADGIAVTGVDPAAASLEVARSKPGAASVRWIHGDATTLPAMAVDVATMTANVAQVFVTEDAWQGSLRGIAASLHPDGHLVFEVRDPARRAWLEWTRDASWSITEVPGVGPVESWVEVQRVVGPLISFRWTYRFHRSGDVLTSDSTLRFRTEAEVRRSLARAGFEVVEVRDAPDRPGKEFVFVARRR